MTPQFGLNSKEIMPSNRKVLWVYSILLLSWKKMQFCLYFAKESSMRQYKCEDVFFSVQNKNKVDSFITLAGTDVLVIIKNTPVLVPNPFSDFLRHLTQLGQHDKSVNNLDPDSTR